MADITQLTELAEQGHGCSIKAALDHNTDSDARKTELVQIQAANEARRQTDPGLPELQVISGTEDGQSFLALFRYPKYTGWQGMFVGPANDHDIVYSERFDPGFPKTTREAKCEP